jgi:L-fucose mutarotase
MLRGVSPPPTPDLPHALASMGQGDSLAIVDANFPAAATARQLLLLPAVDSPFVLAAVLSVLPRDDVEPDPTLVMQVVGTAGEIAAPERDFAEILADHHTRPKAIERHAFDRAADAVFFVLRTGERRLYGNILRCKNAIPPKAT